jgi:hypothetical protein
VTGSQFLSSVPPAVSAARLKEYLVKLFPGPGRLRAGAGLMACVLAAWALQAVTPGGAAALRAHPAANAGNIAQRAAGLWHTSKKTVVSLPGLAAAGGKASGGQPVTAPAAGVRLAAAFAPALDANFPGLASDGHGPPDPNAAASPTQIVEVVNNRLQVYTRGGAPAGCPADLDAFFGKQPGESLFDPRVIYDNVSGKFTVIIAVQSPPPTTPHLPDVTLLRIAHSAAGNACGLWTEYSILGETSVTGIAEGSFIDQPSIGQDRDAFLFGGENFTNGDTFISDVAFSYPKSCAYSNTCTTDFQVFRPAHFATPASSGGTPMIATAHSYFVAVVPNVGYELYRMDNSGNTNATIFTLQATIASAHSVVPPPRDAAQPGTSSPINIGASNAPVATRITSTPTYDGTRIWFTHQAAVSNHPAIRYGAIDPASNAVTTNIAFHSASSDDFNPSIAVGINGASRTIFLNWAYTDVAGGIPVSPAVAAVTIAATDSPPALNGKDIRLIAGGITNDNRFGDYSSAAIDPASPGQACAVTAQEYFDGATNGKWATRISRFGAPGC